jgi:hypothetical protein
MNAPKYHGTERQKNPKMNLSKQSQLLGISAQKLFLLLFRHIDTVTQWHSKNILQAMRCAQKTVQENQLLEEASNITSTS